MGSDGFGWLSGGGGEGRGGREGGGIDPISQPIFGLNPSPTESSNEEKGVKYAIFDGGTTLTGQWGLKIVVAATAAAAAAAAAATATTTTTTTTTTTKMR